MARDLKTELKSDKDQIIEDLTNQLHDLRAQIADIAGTLKSGGDVARREAIAEGNALVEVLRARITEARETVAQQASQLRAAAADQAAHLREKAAEQAAAVKARAVDYAGQAEVAVRNNPATSMGLALGAGFLIGLALTRRGRA